MQTVHPMIMWVGSVCLIQCALVGLMLVAHQLLTTLRRWFEDGLFVNSPLRLHSRRGLGGAAPASRYPPCWGRSRTWYGSEAINCSYFHHLCSLHALPATPA